jgi:MFS family permease
MPTFLAFALWLPLVGITALTLITAANSTMQLSVAPEVRGRVMALYMTIFMGGTPLGAPIVGWVGEAFGARWTLIGGGAITILGTVAATIIFARRRGLAVRPSMDPLPRLHVYAKADDVEPRAAAEHEPTSGGPGKRRKVSA